jgi:hypothetical protein
MELPISKFLMYSFYSLFTHAHKGENTTRPLSKLDILNAL